jgi:flagellar hook-associated protein 3
MAISGTPFASSVFSRVSGTLSRNVLLGNISRANDAILLAQEQISSNKRLVRPSIDPIGTNYALDYESRISRNDQHLRNISFMKGRMLMSDTQLGQARQLVVTAKQIQLEMAQDTADAQQRRLSAIEVDELLGEAVNIANTQYEDRYIFGGSLTSAKPFEVVSGAVVYNGDDMEMQCATANGLTVAGNMPGTTAFSAISGEIAGNVDLNPDISAATKLAWLNRGAGITPGLVSIGDGVSTAEVDLSGAETIGDVIDLINNNGLAAVTAAVNAAGDGLRLTSASGTVIVQEVDGGQTADDLGILTPAAGVVSPLNGTDLDPALRLETPMALLRAGAGLDASGITITNAAPNATYTASLNFAGMATVQDMINAINASGTFVHAELNDAGTGINIKSRMSGARLTLTENGGNTLSQLGLQMTLDRVKIEDLNGGIGVTHVVGDAVDVDISGARTVADIIAAINNDSQNTGGLLVASVVPGQNRISLTDNSVGAGTLTAANINGAFAASNLGLDVAAAGNTITGNNLNPTGVETESVFTALIDLKAALLANDRWAISSVSAKLEYSDEAILSAQGEAGAHSVRIEMTETRVSDENVQLQKLLGEVRDADLVDLATRIQLEQTVYEAALAVAGKIMQTSLLNYL